MKIGNALARKYRDVLEREAHVSTDGVRVVVVHPKFKRCRPTYRNGTVRMPAALFTMGAEWDYLCWQTWRHELQHAIDDRSGLLGYLTRDEAEKRARWDETTKMRTARR